MAVEQRLNELEHRREQELVLAPNEYAYIMDRTKGNVNILAGPNKTSLSQTDDPVRLDYETKRFMPCSLDESKQLKVAAPEGWYVILKNPSADGKRFPTDGSNTIPDLDIGRKVNIFGPCSFALWPGQMAKVHRGHSLKSNQYVIIRVYDEKIAQENWKQEAVAIGSDDDSGDNIASDLIKIEDLKMGNLLIIKGTDVSFFMPPTGVEVYPVGGDSSNYRQFVREAATLEQIEYCQLIDQNGTKRYERGPKVVFPAPTEKFVTLKGAGEKKPSRKFRAIELNPNSGIYIKIIADYEEGDKEFKVGEELFITGSDQPIYFPREEHAIIKYGDEGEEQEIHYGIAIPKGEARYVMDRDSGDISLAKGPQVLLPDPRKAVVIKRILEPKMCQLMYPSNPEALEYNTALLIESNGGEDLGDSPGAAAVMYSASIGNEGFTGRGLVDNSHRRYARSAVKEFGGDSFKRNSEYTKPRTVTLNTKYDGAVTVGPHTGYAIMVVDKGGKRHVVEGPQTVLLEYDETLQVVEFSTGVPKSGASPIKSVYLRIMNNKVSDRIVAKTRDYCDVVIPISFKVNFRPDAKEKWFNVENYTKLLTEHMRSKIRNVVMRLGVEEFYRNSTDIIRDTVLGESTVDEDGVKSRSGFLFEENGMQIYDVDVLEVTLQNDDIQRLLTNSERNVITNNLSIAQEERKLSFIQKTEVINQNIAKAQAETRRVNSAIKNEGIEDNLKTALALISAKSEEASKQETESLALQETVTAIATAKLDRTAAAKAQEFRFSQAQQQLRIEDLQSQVEASVAQGKAFTPDLVAALSRFSDDEVLKTALEAMGPLAAIQLAGGETIAGAIQNIFKGTALADKLPGVLGGPTTNGNGRRSHPPAE